MVEVVINLALDIKNVILSDVKCSSSSCDADSFKRWAHSCTAGIIIATTWCC